MEGYFAWYSQCEYVESWWNRTKRKLYELNEAVNTFRK